MCVYLLYNKNNIHLSLIYRIFLFFVVACHVGCVVFSEYIYVDNDITIIAKIPATDNR